MSIQYKEHEKYPRQILIRKITGNTDINDVMESWNYLLDNNLISGELKGIINCLCDAELEINIDSFKKLIAYLKQHEMFKTLKLAVVTLSPKTIVFPILGEKEKELKIRPFSTEDSAVKWIMSED